MGTRPPCPRPGIRVATSIEYEGYDETRRGRPGAAPAGSGGTVAVDRELRTPLDASAAPDGARELHDSFFAGMFDRSTYVSASGAASCVQVDLTPLGAHLLFGLPMHEVANRIVALEDVVPRALACSTSGSWIELTGKAVSGSSTSLRRPLAERPSAGSRRCVGLACARADERPAFRSDGSATGSAAAVAT